MADDFGYLNARVRARRAELLAEGFFREALSLTFPDFLSALGDTPYGEVLSGDDLGAVDRAVSRHLQEAVGSLPALVSGRAREIVSLLLARADLTNVKAILRAKEHGLSAEEVRAHLVGGTLPEGVIQAAIEAPDAAAVAQALYLGNHPLGPALRRAIAAGESLTQIEVELDRAFYQALRKQVEQYDDQFLRDYVALEIDAVNLSTAFKLAQTGLGGEQPTRYFVPGGRSVDAELFGLVATGDYGALDRLSGTPLEPVVGVSDLGELERRLRCLLVERAHAGVYDADGAGVVTDFVRAKEWEAARLRLLARRAFYNLPDEAVEREVFCS